MCDCPMTNTLLSSVVYLLLSCFALFKHEEKKRKEMC